MHFSAGQDVRLKNYRPRRSFLGRSLIGLKRLCGLLVCYSLARYSVGQPEAKRVNEYSGPQCPGSRLLSPMAIEKKCVRQQVNMACVVTAWIGEYVTRKMPLSCCQSCVLSLRLVGSAGSYQM